MNFELLTFLIKKKEKIEAFFLFRLWSSYQLKQKIIVFYIKKFFLKLSASENEN